MKHLTRKATLSAVVIAAVLAAVLACGRTAPAVRLLLRRRMRFRRRLCKHPQQ